MELTPYLLFDGNCAEAFRHYEKVLGGKLTMMTHGDSPMGEQTTPELRDKVMHVCLQVEGGASIFGSDAGEGCAPYERPQGFSVAISLPDVARAERIFAGLAEGGRVIMGLEKTFWAERFGQLIDRFGTPWMISAGEPTAS